MSILNFFRIGIGPSNTHTAGPMLAANHFIQKLKDAKALKETRQLRIHLYGSLAQMEKENVTNGAILMGLEREKPESIELDSVSQRIEAIRQNGILCFGGKDSIPFREASDITLHRNGATGPHPNAMRFIAYGHGGRELVLRTYYSIGNGTVLDGRFKSLDSTPKNIPLLPYPLHNGKDLIRSSQKSGMSVSEMALRNETTFRSVQKTESRLMHIWDTMRKCVERGCHKEGVLRGKEQSVRQAPSLYRELLLRQNAANRSDPLEILDWISLWTMAVNEENITGGRVVATPTNDTAGILPAVLFYLTRTQGADSDAVAMKFLLTAGTIASIYDRNATLLAETPTFQCAAGIACSMSAAALCEAIGGTVAQVEHAAQIAMEDHADSNCAPIDLAPKPGVEKSAIAAMKAIHFARVALRNNGNPQPSLDKAITSLRRMRAGLEMPPCPPTPQQLAIPAGHV